MNPTSPKPEIAVKSVTAEVSQAPQTDAEGQFIRRQVIVDAPIGPGQGGVVNEQGRVPAILEYKTNVGEHANALKTNCGMCRHWDNKAWRIFVQRCTGPASTAQDRQTIETLRERIKIGDRGYRDAQGQLDVEQTLANFGVCHVLSDWVEGVVGRHPIYWPVAPIPEATCPGEISVPGGRMQIVTDAQPFGLFKPRDLDATKLGDSKRDALLFAASKK